MPAATDTIGSLVIDLRANVAQLQADMDDVKAIVTKSSREMSSQMRADMRETRGVLSLMRDDFGVTIPREIQRMVASSKEARTAILAIGQAIEGLALIGIAEAAFSKIVDYVQKAQAKAAEEAKSTRELAVAAQDAVEATLRRKEALELIGKGEEARHAIEQRNYERELKTEGTRLSNLKLELAGRLALLATYDAQAPATPDRAASAEAGIDEGGNNQPGLSASSTSAYSKFESEHKAQLDALNKAIDEATIGRKQSDDTLFLYEQGLSEARLKNEEGVALAIVALREHTAQASFQAEKAGLDQYIYELQHSHEAEYEIKLQALQDTLDILEKDPSRNAAKISQINAEIRTLHIQHQQQLTEDEDRATEMRRQAFDADIQHRMAAFAEIEKMFKEQSLPKLFTAGGSAPRLAGTLGAFIQGQSDNVNGNTMKDAAAQGKLLEQAMEDLLTPTQKFHVLQAEIIPLMDKYKAYPDVIKALNVEMLKANPEFEKLQQASAEFGKDLANEFDSLILKGESFHDFLIHIIDDLAEIILKATLLKPLENFFAGGSSGTGGILGSLGHILGFADGGSPPVGQVSLVGENGPELFVPQSAGTIIPNSQLGGGGVTNIFNIDARGAAPGSEQAIIRGMQKAMEQTRQAAIAGMIEYQRRR